MITTINSYPHFPPQAGEFRWYAPEKHIIILQLFFSTSNAGHLWVFRLWLGSRSILKGYLGADVYLWNDDMGAEALQ